MTKILSALGFLFVLAFLATAPQACYYDNEEELYPGGTVCDTSNVRYSVEILSIVENECYSCHSQGSNVSGFPFDSYEALKEYALNGKLVERTNDPVSPMPQTGLLPECDRATIRAWVNAGAPNN